MGWLGYLSKLYHKSSMDSVDDIVNVINRSGTLRGDISGRHLDFVYKKLNHSNNAPDFSFPQKALTNVENTKCDSQTQLRGVIVETREHPALEFIVNHFSKTLGLPIQLFHGKNNYSFINSSSISSLVDRGCVELTELNTVDMTASEYNALLLSREFWELVQGRHKILVFQPDAIVCPQSNYSINDFIEFDYIGSQWDEKRPIGIKLKGGNGGLSLRDWKTTMRCLSRFPADDWPGGEDGYFAFHFDVMGAKIGTQNDCAKFSTQEKFLYNSFGAHKISLLDDASLALFLKYCPEAKKILI